MHTAAVVTAVLGCLAIIALGVRFLLTPSPATRDFGVEPGRVPALTQIKGVRDIVSGLVGLVVWAFGTPQLLGWVLLVQALTPLGDAAIVVRNGGRVRHALAVHGATAALLLAAGAVLVVPR